MNFCISASSGFGIDEQSIGRECVMASGITVILTSSGGRYQLAANSQSTTRRYLHHIQSPALEWGTCARERHSSRQPQPAPTLKPLPFHPHKRTSYPGLRLTHQMCQLLT
jgi:hypothetical protein